MDLKSIFSTYVQYLIHPYKTHQDLLAGNESRVIRLSVYESLGASWVFIVLNGIFRMAMINVILITIIGLINESDIDVSMFMDLSQMPTYSFLVLSAVLDVIFYPIFGFFIIQYWEIIIKFFARLLDCQGDLSQKAQDIISVSMSSQMLKIIPVFGGAISGFANLILMYAGLRTQIQSSPILSFMIIISPLFLFLFLCSFFLLLALLLI